MGKTIIISSHILAELEEMCTEIAILEAGKLLASGEPLDPVQASSAGRSIVVRFADGSGETFTVSDDAEQVDLLRRLAADDTRPVLEFREDARRPRGGLHEHHPRDRAVSIAVNPVIGRELTERLRGFRSYLAVGLFVATLALTVFLVFEGSQTRSARTTSARGRAPDGWSSSR